MERKPVHGGKLKAVGHDARSAILEIEFTDGQVRVYTGVPTEVWRRLMASPNPGSFFEDRIADEYPSQPGSATARDDARARLDTLFGPQPGSD